MLTGKDGGRSPAEAGAWAGPYAWPSRARARTWSWPPTSPPRTRRSQAEVESPGRMPPFRYDVDVCDEAQVKAMAEARSREFGKVDILVSNAGIIRRGLLIHSDSDDWKKTIEVMVYGTYHCCKAFVPGMVERNHGRVIIMSSIMGKQANPANSSYAAAKHALIGITRTLAAEVAIAGCQGSHRQRHLSGHREHGDGHRVRRAP